MHIFFSVGEPSGDQHAAHLIAELQRRQPNIRISGFGGPLMERAGCQLLFQLTTMAVMGFVQVVPLIFKFLRLVKDANQFFLTEKPDAVVLVDFPGFNWWIARKAKAAGIPVFYYMPPQLWAWAGWRIRRVRKFVDHVLCGLTFEKDWYAARGVKADYVGHPFFDEVADYPLDAAFIENWKSSTVRNIGVLPGSRNHEITNNWPAMIEVMRNLAERHQNIRFLVAAYKPEHRDRCRDLVRQSGVELPIHWFAGKTPEIIESAECCLMVSGSVSLEMLARKKPAVIIYSFSRLLYTLVRPMFRNLKSITLPNLIAGKRILPEYLLVWRPRRDINQISGVIDNWLSDPRALRAVTDELTELQERVGKTGATAHTAELILQRLGATSAGRYDRKSIGRAA